MYNIWVYWLILSEWVVIHNSGSRALYYMLTAYTISLYQSEENSSTVLLMRWHKNLMCHEFGIFIILFLSFILFSIYNTTFINTNTLQLSLFFFITVLTESCNLSSLHHHVTAGITIPIKTSMWLGLCTFFYFSFMTNPLLYSFIYSFMYFPFIYPYVSDLISDHNQCKSH